MPFPSFVIALNGIPKHGLVVQKPRLILPFLPLLELLGVLTPYA